MRKSLFFIIAILLFNELSFAQLEAAKYSIKNLKVNTPYTDMSPSFWGRGRIIYSSSKNYKGKVKDRVNSKQHNKAFLDIFSGYIDQDYEIKYSKKVNMDFTLKFNQSNVAFSPDLSSVYFTQNASVVSKGVYKLKLYMASVREDGTWTNVKELPFNSNSYSCVHPSVNDDGTKLYFSSDMPGGYGQSDIYVVDILGDNKFSKPKNLGAYINSPYKDNFPDYNNGILYFSSDRPGGLGGLDVYLAIADDLFTEPTNIGIPINSTYDDFSFIINGKTRHGYFTSNRPQGKGEDDIYTFLQETAITNCSYKIEGIVKDQDTDYIIKDAVINIFNEEGDWLNRFNTGSDGKFLIQLNKCNRNYKLEATKKDYTKDFVEIIYQKDKKVYNEVLKIAKEEVIAAEIPEEKVERPPLTIPEESLYLDVKNIEFLLNKYDIRLKSAEELDKVVKIMKENPTLVVEFGAHTDSRGPDDWNLELSIKRAEEVVRYIVSKGIDYNRIYGKGYGETMPINHCVNGVDCTDLEHLQNRRTEFLILAK